eukprot:g2966.t1
MSILYRSAASILAKLLQRKAGIKTLTYSSSITDKHKRPAYALVCETLRFKPVLERLIENAGFARTVSNMNKPMVLVMLYEYLFGHGIKGGGAVKRAIKENDGRLREALQALRKAAGLADDAPHDELLPAHARRAAARQRDASVPRFARVNTVRTTTEDVLHQLKAEREGGGTNGGGSKGSKDGKGCATAVPEPTVDHLIHDLLVFPPGTELHEHPLVASGGLVLQDKASCMPAAALLEDVHALLDLAPLAADAGGSAVADARRCDAIDACAAPGNKTSHLAALIAQLVGRHGDDTEDGGSSGAVWGSKGKAKAKAKARAKAKPRGKVFAIDRDPKRLHLLRTRMELLGLMGGASASSSPMRVEARKCDFLQLDPRHADFAGVRFVLLDPSCSGAGMMQQTHVDVMGVSTGDGAGDADIAGAARAAARDEAAARHAARLAALSRFQLAALTHALKFTQAARISYSTCSMRREENEDVVAAALQHLRSEAKRDGRRAPFALRRCLPAWQRRGISGGTGTSSADSTAAHGLSAAEADCVRARKKRKMRAMKEKQRLRKKHRQD